MKNPKVNGRPSIYGLLDSDGVLRYIGKSNNPKERLKSHLRDARRRNYPVCRWIRKNGPPSLVILEDNCEDWEESERRWIREARADGVPLLNIMGGGNEPVINRMACSLNAHALNERLRADPVRKRIRFLKAEISRAVRQGYVNDRTVDKMRAAARSRPDLFGDWSTTPYRSKVGV